MISQLISALVALLVAEGMPAAFAPLVSSVLNSLVNYLTANVTPADLERWGAQALGWLRGYVARRVAEGLSADPFPPEFMASPPIDIEQYPHWDPEG